MIRETTAALLLIALAQFCAAPLVHAQPAPPAGAVPTGSPLPRVLPPSVPRLGPGLAAPAPPPPAPEGPGAPVDVGSAVVLGSSVYPPGRFEPALAGLRGRVDQGRIEAVRADIVATYRADGYLFTAVSATVDANGALVFSVIEGRIVDVKLDGDIGPAGVRVLRFLNRLTETVPIDVATLERWLLLAQDVPGVTLRTVLRPSAGDPGALSLVAQVSRQGFSGLATADNRGFSATGPEQFVLSIGANSFTEFGERTDATLFYTARSTELFGQLSTEWFAGASGLKLRVYGGRGTTDPSGSLGQIGYHGDTAVIGTSASYPILRSRQQSLSVAAYFDVLSNSVDTGFGAATVRASRDDLRVFRAGVDYASRDALLGDQRSAINVASLRLSQGLGILGASSQGDALAGRLGERVDFTKVSFEASRTQVLFSPFGDATVALQASLAGQYSQDVLPSSEKFYLGGLRFNRGFYSGQVTGDRALTGSIEPQLNTSAVLPGPRGPFDLSMQYYGFYDWGEAWQSRKTDANARLASAGGGVRLFFTQAIELDVEAVRRLTRRPLSGAGVAPVPAAGLYWRLVGRF